MLHEAECCRGKPADKQKAAILYSANKLWAEFPPAALLQALASLAASLQQPGSGRHTFKQTSTQAIVTPNTHAAIKVLRRVFFGESKKLIPNLLLLRATRQRVSVTRG